MIIHNIPLESFVPHGKVTLKMDNGEFTHEWKSKHFEQRKKRR